MIKGIGKFLLNLVSFFNPVTLAALLFNVKISSLKSVHDTTFKFYQPHAVDELPQPVMGVKALIPLWKEVVLKQFGQLLNKEIIFILAVDRQGTIKNISVLNEKEISESSKYIEKFRDLDMKWIPGAKNRELVNVEVPLALPI